MVFISAIIGYFTKIFTEWLVDKAGDRKKEKPVRM